MKTSKPDASPTFQNHVGGGKMETVYGVPHAQHSYDVEVNTPDGNRTNIEVWATNRTQAGSIAKRAGFVVWSMSMIG